MARFNRRGVQMTLGNDRITWYCGIFQEASGQQCGPRRGYQCPDCRAAPSSPSRPAARCNRAGVEMLPGNDGATWYCGRHLGVRIIPGSNGQCGPGDGPQCPDCYAIAPAHRLRLNRAGVEMTLGIGGRIWYCGRQLGVRIIPGSNGQCGPGDGPQCPDCYATEPGPRFSRGGVEMTLGADGRTWYCGVRDCGPRSGPQCANCYATEPGRHRPRPAPFLNQAGIEMNLGTDRSTWYCGVGDCGPRSGPQCVDCYDTEPGRVPPRPRPVQDAINRLRRQGSDHTNDIMDEVSGDLDPTGKRLLAAALMAIKDARDAREITESEKCRLKEQLIDGVEYDYALLQRLSTARRRILQDEIDNRPTHRARCYNRAGVEMSLGTDGITWYCGTFQVSGKQCGPYRGYQCPDCRNS